MRGVEGEVGVEVGVGVEVKGEVSLLVSGADPNYPEHHQPFHHRVSGQSMGADLWFLGVGG